MLTFPLRSDLLDVIHACLELGLRLPQLREGVREMCELLQGKRTGVSVG